MSKLDKKKKNDLRKRLKRMPTDLTTIEIADVRVEITELLKHESLQHLKDLKTLIEGNLTKTSMMNNLIAVAALGFSFVTFNTTVNKDPLDAYIYPSVLFLLFLLVLRIISRDNSSAVILKIYLEILNDLIIEREKEHVEKTNYKNKFNVELKKRQNKRWKPLD